MNKRKYAPLVGLGLAILVNILVLVAPRAGQARNSASGVKNTNVSARGGASVARVFTTTFADGYEQHNLVSDLAGRADHVDPNLVNSWGLALNPNPGGAWWVSDQGTGVSTLYRSDGTPAPSADSPLVVKIPSANGTDAGEPTGIVFNGGGGFPVSEGGRLGSSAFIFATEDGTISGWNPSVDRTNAILAATVPDAVYKGLAIGRNLFGTFLYATNFRRGTIDVFDSGFHLIQLPNPFIHRSFVPGAFTDRQLPSGFAPFGIQNIGGLLFVTYAKQEEPDKDEDEPGPGNGFVNVFNTQGVLIRRLAAQGTLNSPWGLALAPPDFGQFSNHLLVGNFGDGRINAFNLHTGALDGQLADLQGQRISINGLWALSFGNGADGGATNTLFFTAGIEDEEHGLFGTLRAVSR